MISLRFPPPPRLHLAHSGHQVGRRCFYDTMEVIAHQWSTTIILHYQRQLKITIEAGLFFIRFVVLDSQLFQPPGCNGAFGA